MNDLTKVLFQSDCANAPEGCSLDTLAQLRKNPDQSPENGGAEGVNRLKKRARAKYAQNPLILALVDAAKASGDFTMEDSYWNSYHCANHLEQKGEALRGKYCNNRWCLVCSRIRTGKLINKYSPFFEEMQEPHFVTLTAPTVSALELSDRLTEMNKQLKQIQEVMRKRGTPIRGVRKLEVQYNPVNDWYHPHFHLIVEGEYEAQVLVQEWLYRNTTASEKAQDIRPANFDSMVELFKYTTKLCSKDRRSMNAKALHIIFRELRGFRTFQSLGGFGKSDSENDDNINPKQAEKYNHIPPAVKSWYWKEYDWQDANGNPVSGYEPSQAIEEFRNNLEPCNANNVTGNSPQRTSNRNTVPTDADSGRFIPVKQPRKRQYKRPPQRSTQIEIQV